MINLEEEARKRRERLRSSLSKQPAETIENVSAPSTKLPEITRKPPRNDEEFQVPEGEVLLDSSGAEILGLDSKMPDTLEAQVKSLLSPQSDLIAKEMDLIEPKDCNSDLKREYERRMSSLNKQTKRAVVDIVRERLEGEAEEGKETEE